MHPLRIARLSRFVAAVFLLVGCIGAHADSQPPDLGLFFRRATTTMAVMSPSGDYVAMISRAVTDRYVVMVFPAAKPSEITIVARSEVADAVGVNWVNDNRLTVSFADLRADRDFSDLRGALFATDRDGSATLPLITSDWNFTPEITGSIVHSKLLPPKFILLGQPFDGSDDIIVGAREFDNKDRHVVQVTPYRFNTRTRDLKPLLAGKIPENGQNWIFDDSGAPRVFTANAKGKRSVYYRDVGASDWRKLGNFNSAVGEGFEPIFLDYDGNLYVATQPPQSDVSALYRYDPRAGTLASQPLIHIQGFDFVGSVEGDPQAKRLLGFHFQADAPGAVWVDARMKEFQDRIDKALPTTINRISCGHCLSSKFLLVTAASDRQPNLFILFNTSTGKLLQFAEAYPGLKTADMGERNFFRYAARDGLSIPVYVTLPPRRTADPPPAVVLVHGGPWLRGGFWEWSAQAQFLASRGYAVIEPEFRGSHGYGFQLFKAGWKQWGLAMQDDLADAARWAIGRGFADPRRIGIAGASYGGYATLMGLIRDPELFHCGVEWVGVTDISLMYSVTWSDSSNDWIDYGMPVLVADREKDAAQIRQTSPLANANRLHQPLLMAYGDLDRRVPIVHGTELRDALHAVNSRVEWIDYPKEGHSWYIDADNIDFWQHVEKFLDANLKNAH